jgi:hypothetical protein
MPRGVTLADFIALTERNLTTFAPPNSSKHIRADETLAFLERCCELGLVRREHDNGTNRYWATNALAASLIEPE